MEKQADKKKKNICFILEYDGSRYDGWQKQGNTDNTIQGKLEQVLSRMTGQPAEIHGAGRTDGGVHALGQTANAHLQTKLDALQIQDYVNCYLPEDIRVLDAKEMPERFHSRLSAVGKEYVYRIEMGARGSVFQRKYCWTLGEALDVEAMKQAARLLVGRRDFKSFCGNRHMKKSTVRQLDSIDMICRGTCLEMHFLGEGFLYHMVRILVGTLVEVGQKKRQPQEMTVILEAKNRQAAGPAAPAQGLFLKQVFY